MSKSALGKKLVRIMGEADLGLSTDKAAAPEGAKPGMAALLRVGNEATPEKGAVKSSSGETEAPADRRMVSRRTRRLLQASLLIADFLLVLLILVLLKSTRLGPLPLSLCVVALALGAWLTCLALWLEQG